MYTAQIRTHARSRLRRPLLQPRDREHALVRVDGPMPLPVGAL